jgi:hypothetical protein
MPSLLDIKFWIGGIAALITIGGFYPYIRDIFKRKTEPHAYTWLIWAITQGTATAALLIGGGKFGALSLIAGTVMVFVVFILSLRFGTKNITVWDTVLLFIALISIVVWWLLHNPLISVILITIIDLIGYWPTLRKSFYEPWSETLIYWALMILTSILTIVSIENYNFLTLIYLAALVFANSAVWIVCFVRRKTIPRKGNTTV